MSTQQTSTAVKDVALRIRELRELSGFTNEQMAEKLGIALKTYISYESGAEDLPFSFIHNSALLFGVELTDLLEGMSAHLTTYAITRRGEGRVTSKEQNIEVCDLAPRFRNKSAEPYWVTYTYSHEQQNKPIPLVSHSGQEFNVIFSGQLKVQIGDHTETLSEGDSIYFRSSTPHGMIAVGGQDCVFCAIVMPGDEEQDKGTVPVSYVTSIAEQDKKTIPLSPTAPAATPYVYENFCYPVENEQGILQSISFKDEDEFNFAFDVVDAIAAKAPDKLALVHVDRDKETRHFTFSEMSKQSSRAANYLASLGVKQGDRVMLVLKRNHQFWPIFIALHKLGAIAIPATDQLLQKDFEYRIEAAGITTIVCTGQSTAAVEADKAIENQPIVTNKIMVNGERDGWHNYDKECERFRSTYPRTEDSSCGDDFMLMYFTSGTTGYPKIAAHKHTYALGHFITAKYWHNVDPNGVHYTISDTGWGKFVWGNLYGQWLCEAATFCYDFDRSTRSKSSRCSLSTA